MATLTGSIMFSVPLYCKIVDYYIFLFPKDKKRKFFCTIAGVIEFYMGLQNT